MCRSSLIVSFLFIGIVVSVSSETENVVPELLTQSPLSLRQVTGD